MDAVKLASIRGLEGFEDAAQYAYKLNLSERTFNGVNPVFSMYLTIDTAAGVRGRLQDRPIPEAAREGAVL